ncbi:MAG TPA: hypothetical protein VL359_04080, partial [bacterium]|nr:hypothetical protein [bacterium]
MTSSAPWQPQRIGLIGGGGKMGRMLAPLLAAQGYAVEVAGPEQGPAYTALLADCEVVIVTVPILETLGVIHSIAPRLRPGQLL